MSDSTTPRTPDELEQRQAVDGALDDEVVDDVPDRPLSARRDRTAPGRRLRRGRSTPRVIPRNAPAGADRSLPAGARLRDQGSGSGRRGSEGDGAALAGADLRR